MSELSTSTLITTPEDGDMIPIRKASVAGLLHITMTKIAAYVKAELGIPDTPILIGGTPAPGDVPTWDGDSIEWDAPASGYTDEMVRDVVAAALIDSSTIDFTNTDGSDTMTLAVIQSALKPPESMVIACGDETTAITAGGAKVTFRMPYGFTVTGVRASCVTAPTGSTIIIDINEAGSTILSTKLSIDASEKTSATAASAAVVSDASLADDAEMTIDFDQVGSTIAGAGVKVTLLGNRT